MSKDHDSSRIWPRLRSLFKAQEWALCAGILAVLLVIYAMDKDGAFYQRYSLQTLLHRVALFGVLSVGAAIVIIAGGIDLSTGAVVSLASVVSAKLLTEWLRTASSPPPSTALIALAIGLTVLMGAGVGLGHALMINVLRLPPFIATLATMAGLRSLATVLCQNKTITVPFDAYRALGKEQWISLSIFACVAIFMSIVMGGTVLGRHLFALGGNETAARLGLRTRRLKAFAYATAGTLSALGGVLFTGFSGQGDSRMGNAYELTAITAAVVGGCSLAGGVGSIRGTVLGLLLTQIVLKGTGILTPRGIDSTQIEGLVLGTVVLVAVAFNQRFRGGRS